MEQRHLGRSGLRVSAVGLGCNNLGGRIGLEESRMVVHQALDSGITLFDVADVYGRRESHCGASEEVLGAILGSRREDIVLATKFGMPMAADGSMQGASRRYIRQAVEASLTRLRTDRIDLYQVHVPDPDTPIDETLRALDDLIRDGKVLYAGCSNFPAWQVADAHHVARAGGFSGFISCQDELSLLARDALRELVPAMRRYGLGLLPYFPLASGVLTGKYHRDIPPPPGSRLSEWTHLRDRYLTDTNWTILDGLGSVARAHGRTLTELAFGWLLSHDVVGSVIAGATRPNQVIENVAAATRPLTPEECDAITAILPDHAR
ncbi:aldo/keto reductase [Gluconacetobacter diazotrophicus PA1 5]|nr:aldo/keto reductase [Gluconacetobacter diazotrophicus]ACI50206.1 aldo/keto reductase [Gluconacetobacter diazotrophicus PA1 5]TWB08038.1 aryl-alcohol dehydrogenase-like predicted oxidoreductase [Gluconacetobacter diazotrophicus]